MLFIVIAVSQPVNKNVSTGTVTGAKPGTEPGIHKLLANYQTGFSYKFRPMNGRHEIRFFRVEFITHSNAIHSSVTSKAIFSSSQ